MRYTHVFWDFNGTVIDDVGNALACVNDMLARHGRAPITLADYYTYIETPIIGFYRHILPPEELDFDEIAREFHDDYLRHLDETRLADGAYDLLHRLHREGVRQHIITATHVEEAEELTDEAETREDVIWETADLIYFMSVLMYKEGVTWQDVYDELDKRHKEK